MKALFNRLMYPKTDAGRRRYVKAGMKPYRCKFWYFLLIVAGIAGLILSLTLCLKGADFRGLWLIALLSMSLFVLGLQGIELNDKPTHVNQQEIDEMIERKRREQ